MNQNNHHNRNNQNPTSTNFYNQRRQQTKQGRQLSRIIFLRKFNNWIKTIVIYKYTSLYKQKLLANEQNQQKNMFNLPLSVLDLCCGKGADFNKWSAIRATDYLGVDIAINRLKTAIQDLYRPNRCTFSGYLKQADLGSVLISRDFPKEARKMKFDIVSCQFSIHYLFQNEKKIRNFLTNASKQLRIGGYFIGTTTDCDVLISKLRKANQQQSNSNKFGNQFYSIKFDKDKFPKSKGPFGIKYGFYLQGSVGKKIGSIIQEYVYQYLVIFDQFESLAKEYGFRLIQKKNFHDIYKEAMERYRDLKENKKNYAGQEENINSKSPNQKYQDILIQKQIGTWQKVLESLQNAEKPQEQWEIPYLYISFTFQKVEDILVEQKSKQKAFNPFSIDADQEEEEGEDSHQKKIQEEQNTVQFNGNRRNQEQKKKYLILLDQMYDQEN